MRTTVTGGESSTGTERCNMKMAFFSQPGDDFWDNRKDTNVNNIGRRINIVNSNNE